MKHEITYGADKPKDLSERDDCTVMALANCTGVGYPVAHIIMEQAGRELGKAMKNFSGALETFHLEGFGHFRIIHFSNPPTVAQFAKTYASGRYILRVSGYGKIRHVVAMVNGVYMDAFDPHPRKRVQVAWCFVPSENEPKVL